MHPALRQGSDLAQQLGCALLEDGAVQVNELAQTTVPGVSAAGDLCRTPAVPTPSAQVVMAAAQGARAAVVIDQELLFTVAYTETGEHAEPGPGDDPQPPGAAQPRAAAAVNRPAPVGHAERRRARRHPSTPQHRGTERHRATQ